MFLLCSEGHAKRGPTKPEGHLVLHTHTLSDSPHRGISPMMHVAEEGNRRKGDMTSAEIAQSVLGELISSGSCSLVKIFLDISARSCDLGTFPPKQNDAVHYCSNFRADRTCAFSSPSSNMFLPLLCTNLLY